MKTVSSGFKTAIKTNGRQINALVIYGTTTLDSDNLISVNPSFNGSALKSVMKSVIVEADQEIPVGSEINVKCGVYVTNAYEYIDYGYYNVYKAEYNADNLSWTMTCYDKMIKSMVYFSTDVTFPVTVTNYIDAICTSLGLTFANFGYPFPNYDTEIPEDVHTGINYTFRDVLDEIAEITASTVCINNNGELELRYITETEETIDETWLKSINVTIKEKYGKVNSIVFSRSAESDNISLRNEDSIATDGLCEIKIVDNQILNGEDRDNFITDVYNQLNGFEYYIYDVDSAGIMFLELCDGFSISIGENTYPTIMLNDSVVVTQGMTENLYVEMPDETETEYQYATETDKKLKKAMLIVDKQLGEITSTVEDNSGNITELQQTVNGFSTTVEQVTTNTTNISTLIQTVNDVTTAFLQKGYSNLVIDSVLIFGGVEGNNFAETGTWGSYQNSDISNNTVSNYLAKCTALDTGVGRLEWTIRTIPGTAYSVTTKYNNTSGEESSLKINNNGVIITLFSTTEDKVYEEESIGFVATGSYVIVTVETDGTNFSYSDLMMNYGVLDLDDLTPNSLVWQPAIGEVAGTNIRMSYDGIEIFMLKDETGTYTLKHVMDASGSRVVDGSDNIITKFDVDGMVTSKLSVQNALGTGSSQIDVGNFTILAVDDENCIEY